jgi:proteasome assembly chaperone (PAC2) family protein
MKINYKDELSPDFQASVLLAGWPGIGSVGVGAIDYLRRKLDAKPIAEVDMLSYFTADAVVVEKGVARLPDAPTHTFYSVPEIELIIFQSEAQIGGAPGMELMELILDLSEKCGVETVLTCASYFLPISHKEPAQVLGIANNSEFRDQLLPHGVEILQQGLVSGLNGLLVGCAGARSLNAACLMGTMPQYAATIPNPKASREIVRVLERFLGCDLDMSEIDEAVEKMEHTMEDIESQIHKAFSSMEFDQDSEL